MGSGGSRNVTGKQERPANRPGAFLVLICRSTYGVYQIGDV
jgi:hypothetical protein